VINVNSTRVGFALTGSFCTFEKVFEQMQELVDRGYDVIPILSYNAGREENRFFSPAQIHEKVEEITGKKPLTTLHEVEPLGPKKITDVYVLAPATGNSLGKLANCIYDTPALLGAKSHLRNGRPLVIAVSTNDGLSMSAANIGKLLAMDNFYFVPYGQDDPYNKPRSLVAHFDKIPQTVASALAGMQIQPMLLMAETKQS
jgi:dipicolinate synthase subunit B